MTTKKNTKKNTKVFGTDPEYFLGYPKNGTIYALPPVFLRKTLGVPTTETDTRHPVFLERGGQNWFKWHEDGGALELAIAPQTDWQILYDFLQEAIATANAEIVEPASHSGECLPALLTMPTIGWEVERWMKHDDPDYVLCTLFGCDPDRNAWANWEKCPTRDAARWPNRYGGGHIHFSGVPGLGSKPLMAVHSLAFTAGLAGVAYSNQPDLDKQRTFLYGMPGKFRVQKYGKLFNGLPHTDVGIEYRTLSNAWTTNPVAAEQIFTWAEYGLDALFTGGLIKKLWKEMQADVAKAIVECDQVLAKQLLERVASFV